MPEQGSGALSKQLSGDLAEHIRAAFVDCLRPRTAARVGYANENRAFEQLAHKHWTLVPREALEALRHDLVWFKPTGFRYYAPALIMFGLLDLDTALDFATVVSGAGGLASNFWATEKRAVQAFLFALHDRLPEEESVMRALDDWRDVPLRAGDSQRATLAARSRRAFAWDPTSHEEITLHGVAPEEHSKVLASVLRGAPFPLPVFLHSLLDAETYAGSARALSPLQHWDSAALVALRDGLDVAQRELVRDILAFAGHGLDADELTAMRTFWSP